LNDMPKKAPSPLTFRGPASSLNSLMSGFLAMKSMT